MTNLSDADMCSKLSIAECLKPAAAGSVGAINNSEKAALLDFYTNTNLVNPCTGEAIDKDAIFKAMCEKGEVSMSGLDEALDPVKQLLDDCSELKLATCKSSFDNFTPTGYGATINFVCNKTTTIIFVEDLPNFNIDYIHECYEISDLCIQTGMYEKDEEGDIIVDENGNAIPIGMNTRKELTAAAYDAVRQRIFDLNFEKYQKGLPLLTTTQVNSFFKDFLNEELNRRMSFCTVSSGPCSGNVGSGRPLIDIGLCIPQACKC